MKIERKFTPLKDLKLSDDGPGVIEGYRSVYGVIDEGGDIVLKGAFADTLDEYLHAGFTAQSHDWDFKEAVGFPVEAKEDEHGWWVKSQFHSTPDAQNIRTKAKERMDAGKQVGFSFGYAPVEYSYIDAKDYEAELPKYVKADALPAMQIKAQKFNRIRLLKKVEAIEDSIVTAPMNKRAAATAVKDKLKIEIVDSKGMLADQLAQTTPSTWEIESAFRRVICKIAESAKNAPSIGESSFDWRAKVSEVVNEWGPQMQPLIIMQIEEFLKSTDDEFYLKGITGTESFESFEAAGTELKKFAQQMRANHEIRVKEGRVLSASNRQKVQACRDSMESLMGDLDALLMMSEPKPKELEINMVALKAQADRIRNRMLCDFS